MEEIIGLIIVLGILFLGAIYLSNLFKKTSKEKCIFCNKELGKDYLDGKCSFKEIKGDNLLWSHTKCIPKTKLNEWEETN